MKDRWMENWIPLSTLPAGAINFSAATLHLALLIWHYDLQDRTRVLAYPVSV